MTVLDRVGELLNVQLGLQSPAQPLDDLKDDLGADWLDLVEIILVLEDEFDIQVDDGAAQWATVQDIVDYLHGQGVAD